MAASLSLRVSLIPQSDPAQSAKSIATLVEPKPRGSAVAVSSLTHLEAQKENYALVSQAAVQTYQHPRYPAKSAEFRGLVRGRFEGQEGEPKHQSDERNL